MIHETASTGTACSSSISQTFAAPIAAAYYRAFWPRFALIREDVGQCSMVVMDMVGLGSGAQIRPMAETQARQAGEAFASRLDGDKDGILSQVELPRGGKASRMGRTPEELVAFHDINDDGKLEVKEVVESWVMFATAMKRAQEQAPQGDGGQEEDGDDGQDEM